MKFRIQMMALAAALLVFPASGLLAQATAVQENIDYKTVIANYIEATGGESAHKEIKTVSVKGTLSIPAAGLEGALFSVQDEGHSYTKIELPGIGSELVGHDGETVWKVSDMTGPEIIDDNRRDLMLLQSKMSPMLSVEDDYDSVECTGTEEFGGEPCYVLKLQKGDHDPMYYYFSVDSSLMVGSKITQVDPMQGKMEIVSKMSDYKEVGGIKVPHSTTAELPMGISMVTEIESYDVNGKVDEKLFELPDEIKELKEDG